MLHCAAPHLFASRSWFALPFRPALPCGALRSRIKGLAQIRYGKRAAEGIGVDRTFRRECQSSRFTGKKRERIVVKFAANAGRVHPHEEGGLVGDSLLIKTKVLYHIQRARASPFTRKPSLHLRNCAIGGEAAEVHPAEETRRTAGMSISHPKSRYSRRGA